MIVNTLDFYLALLQLHLAVIGIVIAGVIAMVQMLGSVKPRRDIRLLARRRVLAAYGAFLAGLLVVLATGAWVATYSDDAYSVLGEWAITFYASGYTGLSILLLMLGSLVWFGWLVARTRQLLDSSAYLTKYVSHVPPARVLQFLKRVYDDETGNRDDDIYDPFQPIREYIKDNAFKYYDYGTADGLRHFSRLFNKTLASLERKASPGDYVRLSQYIGESYLEFFNIFRKSNSEKRKTDTIELLAVQAEALLKAGRGEGLIAIIRSLEGIAQLADDDEEVIAVIERIGHLLDTYLGMHAKAKWSDVAEVFEEVCLSVTRISESYYIHRGNSLKTMPVIGYYTGKHRTVMAALVGFYRAYEDIGDRYTDPQPVHYFEAIEGVLEVIFARLGEIVENGQQNIGFNLKYHDLAHELYQIYYIFGLDAIEHKKPELFAQAVSNLRRIIKPAKNFHLDTERATITRMFVELSAKGVLTFGDIVIKSGGRTISQYAHETLDKHSSASLIKAALTEIGTETPLDGPETKKLITVLHRIK